MSKTGYVYILTNKPGGTLYIGITSDLVKRIFEHKQKLVDGFSKRYDLDKLVYYAIHESIEEAIHREKCMKEWQRAWKLKRIAKMNPDWNDLYDNICQ